LYCITIKYYTHPSTYEKLVNAVKSTTWAIIKIEIVLCQVSENSWMTTAGPYLKRFRVQTPEMLDQNLLKFQEKPFGIYKCEKTLGCGDSAPDPFGELATLTQAHSWREGASPRQEPHPSCRHFRPFGPRLSQTYF